MSVLGEVKDPVLANGLSWSQLSWDHILKTPNDSQCSHNGCLLDEDDLEMVDVTLACNSHHCV